MGVVAGVYSNSIPCGAIRKAFTTMLWMQELDGGVDYER